ncbi:unnamed protein product [Brachionus calyciflorus]|uniref:ISXO2-like transposase domain-containing protein n=1 Tax=Brachionus calyciflorus TaxID=104777 RepID=A0A814RCR8_9BILA|nr:unnamed protein product [Brachionus calyciflorus]
MYERETSKCLFFVVEKRDAVNLFNIIYKYVLPNTTINLDCWAAYNRIKLLNKNYHHLTVNHDLHFVDPKTRCHTNSIESIWNKVKLYLKKVQGISRVYLQSYLDQFTWVQNKKILTWVTRVGTFSAILDTLSRVYPANKLELKDNLDSELDLDLEKDNGDLIEVEEGEEIEKNRH